MDKVFMRKAISLAKRGAGRVSPNPMVGAVIVKDGKIVSTGYHARYGGPHAEAVALEKAGEKARGATLYVNLEPCVHYGKTPPCVPKIIKAGIRKVVIATFDPNPLVSGKGVEMLKSAGIEVVVGILENEARRLNEAFFKWIKTRVPFVVLKVALTLDGKIATYSGDSKWITSLKSRRLVHKYRAFYDAVLVGADTVLRDDPELTVRLIKGRNPVRVVLDSSLRVPLNAKVFLGNGRRIVFHSEDILSEKASRLKDIGIELYAVPSEGDFLDLHEILRKLGQLGIASVMVEGGRKVFSSFLKEELVDKIFFFIAPKILGGGLGPFDEIEICSVAEAVSLKDLRVRRVGDDFLIEGYLS